MTTATALTVDREVVERFIVEVDALAEFDSTIHGGDSTWLQEHIYGILDEFEKAIGLRPMSDEESERLHERGMERGEELVRQAFAEWLPKADEHAR